MRSALALGWSSSGVHPAFSPLEQTPSARQPPASALAQPPRRLSAAAQAAPARPRPEAASTGARVIHRRATGGLSALHRPLLPPPPLPPPLLLLLPLPGASPQTAHGDVNCSETDLIQLRYASSTTKQLAQ